MRWMSFKKDDCESFGFVTSDEQVVDVGSDSDYATLKDAIAANALSDLAQQFEGSDGTAIQEVEFLPPITNPDKILCVGLNYKDHQAETGRGGEDYPTIFVRFAEAQVGHNGKMIRPRESNTLDYEGEIVLVIGQHGRRIPKDKWQDYVAGYSCYNDGSVRGYQRHTSQFTPGKNFTATGGFGPWIMTPDEVGDPDELEIFTRLNGELMQNAKASLLVFGFAELVEYCSTFTDLRPGDLIVTGTPGGVGSARNPPIFMDEGDQIDVFIEPIGTLSHTVTVG
ncbi:MAG: fumarylacetoacetate hydrolase family protein [Gammaproteobacteria bacterium]|nr:fumarylacetoacetate hydrolase family protein [Gammaproteobacteria bacterium]